MTGGLYDGKYQSSSYSISYGAIEAIDCSSQFALYNPGQSSNALTHVAARFSRTSTRTRTITIEDSCAG